MSSSDPLLEQTAQWSWPRRYAVSAAVILAMFVWSPVALWLAGPIDFGSTWGTVRYSALLAFVSTPLTAALLAHVLRHGDHGGLSVQRAFILAKMGVVTVTAILLATVVWPLHEAPLAGPSYGMQAGLTHLLVGIPLSIPFGYAYGLIFRAILGVMVVRRFA